MHELSLQADRHADGCVHEKYKVQGRKLLDELLDGCAAPSSSMLLLSQGIMQPLLVLPATQYDPPVHTQSAQQCGKAEVVELSKTLVIIISQGTTASSTLRLDGIKQFL